MNKPRFLFILIAALFCLIGCAAPNVYHAQSDQILVQEIETDHQPDQALTWQGRYCPNPGCDPIIDELRTGTISKGQQIGCPHWIEIVTRSYLDPVLKVMKFETARLYLDHDTCKVISN